MNSQKRIRRIIIAILIAAGCLWVIFLISNGGYIRIGERLDGTELFPDSYWENVTGIIYWDFDETRYEVSDVQSIQDIQHILSELTYTEIKNPELEGSFSFEIHMVNDIQDFWISSDVMGYNGRIYYISDKTVDTQLSEYIMRNSTF